MKALLLSVWLRRGFRLSAACIIGIGCMAPAVAGSVTALSFVESAASTNAFLVESSRFAESQAGSRRIVAFAQRESADRPRIVAALADWAAADRRATREADLGPSLDMLGRIFGPADRAITIIVHDGRPVLPDLAQVRGAAFDDLYVASQTDALTRLVGFYVDFIKNGDDETLRALAVRDLPRARQLLADVRTH